MLLFLKCFCSWTKHSGFSPMFQVNVNVHLISRKVENSTLRNSSGLLIGCLVFPLVQFLMKKQFSPSHILWLTCLFWHSIACEQLAMTCILFVCVYLLSAKKKKKSFPSFPALSSAKSRTSLSRKRNKTWKETKKSSQKYSTVKLVTFHKKHNHAKGLFL